MIYCATKPIEEYQVTYNGFTSGLYNVYGEHPALLQLILMTTLVPFGYEIANYPKDKIIVCLDEIHLFRKTLRCTLNNGKITQLLSSKDPVEIAEEFLSSDIRDLDFMPLYDYDTQTVKDNVKARAYAWSKTQLIVPERKGNIIKMTFGKRERLSDSLPDDWKIAYDAAVVYVKSLAKR